MKLNRAAPTEQARIQVAKKRQQQHGTEFYQRDVVARWRASGLSQAEFCRQEGIPQWKLSSWKDREPLSTGNGSEPKTRMVRTSSEHSRGIEFAAIGEPVQPYGRKQGDLEQAKFVPLVPDNEGAAVRDILRDARRTPVAEICFGEVSVRIWRGADQETMRLVLDAVKEFYCC